MKAVAAGVILVCALALTGCTADGTVDPTSTPSETPTPVPATTPNPAAITPVVPAEMTAESVEAESTRIADAILALIQPAAVTHVDAHGQLVKKQEVPGQNYAIIRTITLDPAADAIATAQDMAATLVTSGWLSTKTTNANGVYVNALSSGTAAASAWFAVIGGDVSVAGESVVSLQLASPDIP